MQELVKAAAEIARAHGTPIVVVGPPIGASNGADPVAAKHAEESIKGLTGEVQMLRAKLVEAEKIIHNAGTVAAGKSPDSAPIMQENAQLKAKVNELQGLISSLQAKGNGAPAPGVAVAAPAAFADCPLDVLGLEPAILKKVQKLTINSVGALHDAFKEGRIYAKTTEKPDGKFTKDECIDIAVRLMGKVPPAHGAPAGTAPQVAPAAPVTGGPPPGMSDLTWEDRLRRCRKKDAEHIPDAEKKLNAAREALNVLSKQAPTPDSAEKLNAAREAVREAEKNVELLNKQLLAMLVVACGFDPGKAQEAFKRAQPPHIVDECLKLHGVALAPAGA